MARAVRLQRGRELYDLSVLVRHDDERGAHRNSGLAGADFVVTVIPEDFEHRTDQVAPDANCVAVPEPEHGFDIDRTASRRAYGRDYVSFSSTTSTIAPHGDLTNKSPMWSWTASGSASMGSSSVTR